MKTFEENIDAITAQRAAPDATIKEALAPTRAALEQGKKDFLKLAAELGPVFEAARIQAQKAASADCRHAELTRCLREAGVLLAGTPEAYNDAIRQIEGITARACECDPTLRPWLQARPRNIGESAGALKDMARRVQFACHELEEQVREKAAGMLAPAPIMTTPSRAPVAEVHVES